MSAVVKMEYVVSQTLFGEKAKSTVLVTVFVKPVEIDIPAPREGDDHCITRYVILGHLTDRESTDITIVHNPKAGVLVGGWQIDQYAKRVGSELALKSCLDQIQEKISNWFGRTTLVQRQPGNDWDSV